MNGEEVASGGWIWGKGAGKVGEAIRDGDDVCVCVWGGVHSRLNLLR